MNSREQSGSRTPGVQGTTVPPSLVYFVHTHSLIELFGSYFCEPYQSVQEVYEKIVCHGLVNIRELSGSHTPVVQGSTGSPSLVQLVYA